MLVQKTPSKAFCGQSYSLFIFLFFLPLFFPPFLADKYDLPKVLLFYSFICLLLITDGFAFMTKKILILPSKNFLKLLFLFFIIYLLSTVFSVNPLTSLLGYWGKYLGSLVYFTGLVFLFLSSFAVFKKKKSFFFLSLYLTASGLLASLFGIYQYACHFIQNQPDYRIRSTIGEPNRLALFLITVLPLSFSLFLKEKNNYYKSILLLVNLVISTAVVLCFSRAAWISLGLTIFLLFMINFKKKTINLSFLKSNPKFLVVFFLLITALFLWQNNLLIKRSVAVFYDLKDKKGSTHIRLKEWQFAWNASLQREKYYQFVLGNGPQTSVYFFLKEKKPDLQVPVDQRFWRTPLVRNQYLDHLLNLGLLGLIAYLALIFFILKVVIASHRKDLFYWGASASWLTIVIASFFYYQTITTSIFFWVLSAAILTEEKSISKAYSFRGNKLIGCFFIFLGLLISMIIFCVAKGDFYIASGNSQKAVQANPFNSYYWQRLSLHLSEKAYLEKDLGLFTQAINTAKKAVSLNKLEPQNLQALQKAYYLAGISLDKNYHQKALFWVQKWQEKDPYNPFLYDSLGLIQLDLGQLTSAYLNFQKAISLNPDYLPPYLHSAEALKQQGKIESAIKFYQKAIDKNPFWETAKEELKKTQETRHIDN